MGVMPVNLPFSIGPLAEINLPAAGEMAAAIACLYAGDKGRLIQIMGPEVFATTELLLFYETERNQEVRVAIWTQPGHVYIVFGGTHTWHQWPRHFTGTLSARYLDDAGEPIGNVGVHGFHQLVARIMWPRV